MGSIRIVYEKRNKSQKRLRKWKVWHYLEEVVVAPVPAVAVVLPLVVHVEQRQVVALRHKELLARRVRLQHHTKHARQYTWPLVYTPTHWESSRTPMNILGSL